MLFTDEKRTYSALYFRVFGLARVNIQKAGDQFVVTQSLVSYFKSLALMPKGMRLIHLINANKLSAGKMLCCLCVFYSLYHQQ